MIQINFDLTLQWKWYITRKAIQNWCWMVIFIVLTTRTGTNLRYCGTAPVGTNSNAPRPWGLTTWKSWRSRALIIIRGCIEAADRPTRTRRRRRACAICCTCTIYSGYMANDWRSAILSSHIIIPHNYLMLMELCTVFDKVLY